MDDPASRPVLDMDLRMKRLLLAAALLYSLAVPAVAAPPPPPETRQQCIAAVMRQTANLRPMVRHAVREALLPRCMRLPDGRAG